MNFPAGFDPLGVTKLTLNGCYFAGEDIDEAFRRAEEFFPNAEFAIMLFEEHPDWCVVEILPKPALTDEAYKELTRALEDLFPQGPNRGIPSGVPWDCSEDGPGESLDSSSGQREEDRWQPGDAEAWKKGGE